MKQIYIRRVWNKALKFATAKHLPKGQKVIDDEFSYGSHLRNVAMEIMLAKIKTKNFDARFAVQVALLHHTIEDKVATYKELERNFGEDIAEAVSAMTIDETLPKEQQKKDSLTRIKKLQPEVWAVKLADRITSLQPPPPDWSNEKRTKYQEESRLILSELKGGNEYLANRLEGKIKEYGKYI